MNTLLTNWRRLIDKIQRRPQLDYWGDARALPYTEGQAVMGPGSIGPSAVAHVDQATV